MTNLLICITIIFILWADYDSEHRDRIILAAIDNGCNTHIDIPAKPEYREYNEENL